MRPTTPVSRTHQAIAHINHSTFAATFELYYNGPGKIIWDAINKEKRQSNGQYSVALSRVRELDSTVPDDERVATVAQEMATKIN